MRLDLLEQKEGDLFERDLNSINRFFHELEITCPFLPKSQIKRSLELQSDFALLKLKNGIYYEKMNIDQLITKMIELFMDHKKKGAKIDRIGSKVLEMLRKKRSLTCGKQFEALIPECEEFKEFHVDLLNIVTELTLDKAIESKKTIQFSELITEAINFNVRSLNIRPNVMAYFEFLKLTKLQDPKNFIDAVKTCLLTVKNRIAPNEDIRGKLQIIRLIVYETGKLEDGLTFAEEVFVNCDFNEFGPVISEEILCLIDETDNTMNHNKNETKQNIREKLESFLTKFGDLLRTSVKSQNSVVDTLLRIAEKNFIVSEQFSKAEEILLVIQGLGTDDYRVKLRLVRCFLRLDKLEEAKESLENLLNGDIKNKRDIIQLQLELALRNQDDYEALSSIEQLKDDPLSRSEHFLVYFNLLKARLSPEMKMSLLKGAQSKFTVNDDKDMKIDILRGIISLLYDGIIESGLSPYKSDFEDLIKQRKTLIILNIINSDMHMNYMVDLYFFFIYISCS